MEGLQPSEHTFQKKDQAVSMASKVAVKIDGEKNNVSPQRLLNDKQLQLLQWQLKHKLVDPQQLQLHQVSYQQLSRLN